MFKKITAIILLVNCLLIGGVGILPVSAAGASISLTLNKTIISNGNSLIVGVYMNGGGTPINSVRADLVYPASKLQYVGFSGSGGAFEIGASSGGGGGSASIERGTTAPVSGSGLIGTVTFKALASSGSANIDIASSSVLLTGAAQPVAHGNFGKAVSFGVAPVTASAPVAPAAPKDSTAPKISDIKTTAVTPFSATVTWTTDEAASSAVEYGLDNTYGLGASATGLVANHSVALGSAFLTPKALLHYHVKSADKTGNVTVSPDQTLQLPGVPVTVIVRGTNGKPQAGATVSVDNATGTTDKNGKVTLESGLGNKQITTSYNGVTVNKPITVSKTAKPLPPYQLALGRAPVSGWMWVSVGLAVLLLGLLAMDAVLFGSKILIKLNKFIPHLSLKTAPAVAQPAPVPTSLPPAQSEPTPPRPDLTSAPVAQEPASPSPAPTPKPVDTFATDSDITYIPVTTNTPAKLSNTTTIAKRLKKHHPKSHSHKSVSS